MKDLLKLAVLLPSYFWLGPALGAWAASSRKARRAIFCLMIFLTALAPGKFTLMVVSMEKYRGHTKGFEGNFIEVLAIALMVASSRNRYGGWLKWGPGLKLYLAWICLSLVSLIPATQFSLLYGVMAAVKFSKAAITFLGAYHFLREEEDIRWILRTMAGVLIWYAVFGLKERLLGGVWQFKGYFEHQNPMCMWTYLMAIPLLSAALHKKTPAGDANLYLIGFGSGALAILLSVSRAGLGALAAGAVVVLLIAWIRKPTPRVIAFTITAAVGAMLVSAFAMNSFRARLKEVKESAQVTEFDLRDVLNMQSRAMLHNSPVGIGWNCYGVANSRPYGAKFSEYLEDWDASRGFAIYDENYYANPLTESLYWLLLAETGYPGFMCFLIFAGATVMFAARSAWTFRGSLAGAFACGLTIALTICYFHGTVERILTQTKNLAQWTMLCGLVAAMEHRRRLKTDAMVPATDHVPLPAGPVHA